MPVLNFKGKSSVYSHHLGVPFHALQIDKKKSFSLIKSKNETKDNSSLSDNLIVHGDNLHALKSLMPKYAGKVKCIYIDPPYNTGNEGWKYNDNVNSPFIQEWLKQNGIGTDDLERHDKWLCMMWPRLQLLKELLSEDGVIFISIDDNEQHHLKAIIDEIFGEEKFVGSIGWESKTKTQNTKDSFNKLQPKIEYILCYSNIEKVRFNLYSNGKKEYPERDSKGAFRYHLIEEMSSKGTRGRNTMVFPIYEIKPKEGKQWQWGSDTIKKFDERGDMVIKNRKPYLKMREIDEINQIQKPFWAFFSKEEGTAESAKKELNEIFGYRNHGFETVKPINVIKKLIFHSTKKNDIILDSFAGSGTTAHAVLDLNKEDGGNRKFILVECEDYADEITAERIRRVMKGVSKAKDEKLKQGLGGSFTYCTLGKEMNEENLIKGKSLPSYKVLADYVYYVATGRTLDKVNQNEDFYVGKTDQDTAFFVIYKPNIKFLRSKESAVNLDRKNQIQKIMYQKKCEKAIVFATAHYFDSANELANEGITFCQLPFAIYKVAGA